MSKFSKLAIAVTSSVIIIPYTVVFMSEWIYSRKSLVSILKSLSPTRVISYTEIFLKELYLYKYLGTFIKSIRYYAHVASDHIVKDIQYGANNQTLDVYLPEHYPKENTVVIFIFGERWSTFDKSMFSFVCTSLVNQFDIVLVCPNYSTYPKGYADDMIQDISDVIIWTQKHVGQYGGNPDKIVLIGHSSGAHLAAMVTIELAHKHLKSLPAQLDLKLKEPLKGGELEVNHYDSSCGFLRTYFADRHIENISAELETGNRRILIQDGGGKEDQLGEKLEDGAELVLKNEVDEEKVEVVKTEDAFKSSFVMVPRVNEELETYQAFSSIKLVIGLSGVYDIGAHYRVLQAQGRESTSYMSRAMYDQQHFEQFSPVHALKHLCPSFKLPPFFLIHGDNDHTVPLESSLSFGRALCARQEGACQLSVLKECNHYQVCLDLMQEKSLWYDCLFSELRRALEMHNLD